MKVETIELFGVTVDGKGKDFKTLTGARKYYERKISQLTNGEIVTLFQYTTLINHVEFIDCNM